MALFSNKNEKDDDLKKASHLSREQLLTLLVDLSKENDALHEQLDHMDEQKETMQKVNGYMPSGSDPDTMNSLYAQQLSCLKEIKQLREEMIQMNQELAAQKMELAQKEAQMKEERNKEILFIRDALDRVKKVYAKANAYLDSIHSIEAEITEIRNKLNQ